MRYRLRDESLEHQIVLLTRGVSCNCRRVRPQEARGGFSGYETFAPLGSAQEAFEAYLNPANHRGMPDVA